MDETVKIATQVRKKSRRPIASEIQLDAHRTIALATRYDVTTQDASSGPTASPPAM